jgi:hypothetical protein
MLVRDEALMAVLEEEQALARPLRSRIRQLSAENRGLRAHIKELESQVVRPPLAPTDLDREKSPTPGDAISWLLHPEKQDSDSKS